MIRSCRDKDTRKILDRIPVRKFDSIAKAAVNKLAILNAATELRALSLPILQLEKLTGNRKGQYNIRINSRYRICFFWSKGDATEVEIVDYH